MKKQIYIVLTHKYTPSKKERGKWEVIENCEIVDNLKSKHRTNSTIIIELFSGSIIKNRGGDKSPETYKSIYDGLFERYPQQMEDLSKILVPLDESE